jgi:hypothetical protein
MALIFAEAAAAEIAAAAAAEAAAVTAAEIAAAEAASVAAAEAASTAAAQTAAQAAAQQAGTQAGIMGIEGATANAAPLTAEATQAAAMNSGFPTVQATSAAPSAGIQGIQGLQGTSAESLNLAAQQQAAALAPPPAPSAPLAPIAPPAPPPSAPSPMGIDGQIPANQFIEPGSGGINSMANEMANANLTANVPPPSALEVGMDKAMKFAEKNPLMAMSGAYMGASALGLLNPSAATFNDSKYSGPLSKYRLSPDFQPGRANPADFQYTPRYAEGGVMGMGAMPQQSNDVQVGYNEAQALTPNNGQMYASGGQINLQGTFDVGDGGGSSGGQFGQAGANGYQAVGSGFGGGNMGGIGGGGSLGSMGGYDPQSVAANPQGFLQHLQQVRQHQEMQQMQNPYARMGQLQGMGLPSRPNMATEEMGIMNMRGLGFDKGGQVASYAKGGSLTDSIEQYQKMLAGDPMKAPAVSRDVGIYRDEDPDTRYQDALTAAQIRQSKINQRAYVTPPAAKRPTPMGQLQMASVKPRKRNDDDVEAAQGGIMHSSLGGYAAGGNPRLLKGPGDGMSDNIPATINGRQPARLADGEFVIPADVVSHLGNGSTEAGAKQLHAMMNKIRKARTGNSKQGRQINPRKYLPK